MCLFIGSKRAKVRDNRVFYASWAFVILAFPGKCMKRILLALFCFVVSPLMASHIVGGEFEILYLGNYQYRINLIYYFDLNNNTFTFPPQQAQPEQQEPTIVIAIFRKSDHALMRNVTLSFLSKSRVSYTQPACSTGEILTDKLIYTTIITLPPEQYNSDSGYYLTWERCCRNYTITNIVSDEPPNGDPNYPNAAGQAFYLEFPPVVKNGQPFINSSPQLFPPLNDYACPGKPYYADFAGTDEDGDSLVYSLVTPLSTHSSAASPAILRPAPFPDVKWRAPFNLSNIVNGAPDLHISKTGFLTVTPMLQGLFVFAVKCEEFRNGKKIGEVRRDFQMLVVDECEHAEPPQILGKKLQDATFAFDDNMHVTFTRDVSDENRCIQVQVSDPDAANVLDDFKENVSIRAIALNFKKDMASIVNFPLSTTALLTDGSTKTFEVCFDKCPPFFGGPFQVGIVAYDDACSLPLSDTLRVTVNIEPPVNNRPQFFVDNNSVDQISLTVPEGSAKRTWTIEAVDNDKDESGQFQHLNMFVLPEPGFVFGDAGMEFRLLGQINNTLQAEFSWTPDCSVYDFTHKTEFNIRFLVEDEDDCNQQSPDTVDFKLKIDLPPDSDPVITTDLPETLVQNGITKKVFESLEFNVYGSDADPFMLKLRGQGDGFQLSDYNILFPSVAGVGSVSSHFSWNIDCEKLNLSQKSDFEFNFIVVDSANQCQLYKTDTLTIKVKVKPPGNTPPLLNVTNTNKDLTFQNNHQTLFAGQQISLALGVTDPDSNPQDKVTIAMAEASGNVEPAGYLFEPAEGIGNAETTFTWDTDCALFKDGVYENHYLFKFVSNDNRCFSSKADTVSVAFTLLDVPSSEADFIPPNFITPNGDNHNEFFAMVRLNDNSQLVSILPPDNCIGKFVSIAIYNRWGNEVFQSFNRDFRWFPTDEAAGIYYYTLRYSHKEYKGSITLQD